MDLKTSFEAIRISSGNSFVHETESQVIILNGSRDINFTMDLVLKDISLFNDVAERSGLSLELAPLLIEIFKDGLHNMANVNFRQILSDVLKRQRGWMCGLMAFLPKFPDDEPEQPGYEITP